jgi:glycosyltransferase involved in cell wall biosynthesis
MADIKKPLLLFQAPVSTRSGYGDHARDLVRSLIQLDKYDVRIISTRWGVTPMTALTANDEDIIQRIVVGVDRKPDVYIQVTVPNEFQPMGNYNIGITAGIETTACSVDFIQGCNRMDMIIVPSEFSKEVLVKTIYSETDKNTKQVIKQHALEKPIEVLFEGYNEEFFGKKPETKFVELDKIKEDFAYLFVGHWLRGDLGHDRKDVGMMIKSFCHAFRGQKNPPALILKTSSAGFSVMDREATMGKLEEVTEEFGKNTPPIYLLHGELSDEEMNAMYHHPKVKAMISFTHGEGFGRPLLEFSLTGKPVVASNWSGHLDFLKSGAVLLDGELKDIHESAQDQFILAGTKWFYVNYTGAIKTLTDIYKGYDKYKPASQQLGKQNQQNFGLEKMTKLFDTILTNYVPTIKQFIPLNLPKLTKVDE